MTTAEYITTQSFDKITYTRHELSTTFAMVENDALMAAADKLWDGLKGSVEAYWEGIDLVMEGTDSKYARIRDRRNERIRIRLHTYAEAFEALGLQLEVAWDWCPKCLYKVTLLDGNNVRGCIRK